MQTEYVNAGTVYKYVPVARIDLLENGCIRFSQPGALNDPFESLPCLTQYKAARIESLESQTAALASHVLDPVKVAESIVDSLIDNAHDAAMNSLFAFLSLSKIPDNLLMWSHYADSHKGFVVGFDARNPFFSPGSLSKGGLQSVRYSRERFVLPRNGFAGMSAEAATEANDKFIFTKCDDWGYEQELRLLSMPDKADKLIPDGVGRPPICLYIFPPEAISEVILGFRMEAADKERIVKVVETKYPHAIVKQALVDSTKYALRIVPYSEFLAEDERMAFYRNLTRCRVRPTN